MNIALLPRAGSRTLLCKAVIVACLSTSLGMSVGIAADAPASDGIVSTINDAAITTKVKAKLMSDAGLKKSDISVSTFNGVTTLSGLATSATAKSQAEAHAKSVKDVKSVDASALAVAGK